jgi:predicted nucleic acid-binding protein
VIVVDASVAVKWLISEKDEAAADQLLRSGQELTGPALLRVEVAAAVARKARFQEITPREAATATALWIESLLRGEVHLIPEDDELPRALQLALELNHPLQDCLYLALAERLDAPLITADEKFANKAQGVYPRVRRLSAV